MDFIKIYFRTALAVLIDRTEMETEEIGECMHACMATEVLAFEFG